MYLYLLLLRLIHISCGVFWAGGALFLAVFVFPAIVKAGPDGGKITQAIMSTNKLPTVLTVMGLVTVLSGILLMYQISAGFTADWFTSRYAFSLTLGGITAIIAFLQGIIINRPGAMKMQVIGKTIAMRGGPPTPEEQAELMKIRSRIILSTQWIAAWVIISIASMGIARYI